LGPDISILNYNLKILHHFPSLVTQILPSLRKSSNGNEHLKIIEKSQANEWHADTKNQASATSPQLISKSCAHQQSFAEAGTQTYPISQNSPDECNFTSSQDECKIR
jgi:hypothetical protein